MSDNEPTHLEVVAEPPPSTRGSGDVFCDGASIGVGSLPHRDAEAAAAFALSEFSVATVPSLPRRSPCESMIPQALVGLPGVAVGVDGDVTVDSNVAAVAAEESAIVTDVAHEAFGGVRSFVELARKINFDGNALKWQHVGPVTLGSALCRAGIDSEVAFDVALAIVRSRVSAVVDYLADSLPSSPMLVMLDEPAMPSEDDADFPLAPDEIADTLSSALAAVGPTRRTGVHTCGAVDLGLLTAAGPDVLSFPVRSDIVNSAGYVDRFVNGGGLIAWGVVATDGPVPGTSQRGWRHLSDLWCELVQAGCDATALRRRSLVTPHCGLAGHSVSVARRIARLNAEIGERVASQATATRFVLGA